MAVEVLERQRQIWAAKPQLRLIYQDFSRRLAKWMIAGPTVEIGAGSGNLRSFLPQALATDLVPSVWIDAAMDAQALAIQEGSVANIVGIDVLHHLPNPMLFFRESVRVLRPGGRIVLIEPAITPGSYLFYRFLHPEPLNLRADPTRDELEQSGAEPFDSNQAIPTLMFGRLQSRFMSEFPNLRMLQKRNFSFLAYPLSGGFRRWTMLPTRLVRSLLAVEELISALGPLMGFRMLVVLEKHS